MKTLVYVPIIHTAADLGSIAKDVAKRGVADLGEDLWQTHKNTVNGFWDAVSDYFSPIDVSGMKIYQDGMVAEGEVGAKIVEEGVKSGSKNYHLLSKLLKRGAFLVKTEDFNLVREERDRLLKITRAKNLGEKLLGFVKYKLTKDKLLNKRDRFIAKRISDTLNHGETAILFIGAYHNIRRYLPKGIQIKETKDMDLMVEYQRLLPFYNKSDKNKRRFEELAKYLVSPIIS